MKAKEYYEKHKDKLKEVIKNGKGENMTNMNKYINTNKIIDLINEEIKSKDYDEAGKKALNLLKISINYIPEVEVEKVRHSKWVMNGDNLIECNICKKESPLDFYENYIKTSYCPNCGAKMDLE